jgi:hypothetical protein
LKHKRDLIVRSRTREGVMHIPAAERAFLEYKIRCPHCDRMIRQSIVTNLFAGDLLEANPTLSEHICAKCGGKFTAQGKQAARDHLRKLQVAQPQFSERLLNFFRPEGFS